MIRAMLFRLSFAFAVLSANTTAFAETALEARVISLPMPHTAAAGGKPVLVHWSKSIYSSHSTQDNAKIVADRRREVDECLRSEHRAKLHGNVPVNPPQRWPNRVLGARFDYYTTANYRITYSYGWAYAVHPDNCGWLNERVTAKASLESRAGSCEIDLDKRTAKGVCDFALHQKAAPTVGPERSDNAPRPSLTPMQEQIARMSMAARPQPTGARKSIAGFDCAVFAFIGRRVCITKAGSFQAVDEGSLVLEDIGPTGDEKRALEAHVDTEVGEQVFAPHLRGGFKIESRKPLAPFSSPAP